MILIPVSNDPNQKFAVSIPAGTVNFTLGFEINWNEMAGYWTMSLSDANGGALIEGLPMLTGQGVTQNLLRQFGHLNIGRAYIIPIGNTSSDSPQVGDWGVNFVLIWDAGS